MKRICFFILSLLLFSSIYGQNDAILLTIGDEKITQGEFVNTYNKNNDIAKATPQELRDYLNLFINFKLKVKEGKAKGLDTAQNFVRELNSYRNQSAQQYLIDREVTNHLLDEAIERSRYIVRASHILIECSATASPADTLSAYKKTLAIRKEILNGKPFSEAAVEYSQDPSAKDRYNKQAHRTIRGNKGELGYFTVFNLIYPFETAAYNTKVGEISMPIRTNFGYHLVYVQDKYPAVDKIKIAQIFIEDSLGQMQQATPETRQKLIEIQEKLAQGVAFEALVKEYSEDQATNQKDGVMEPFSPSQRPGNFIAEILKANVNGVTDPIYSNLGWHIIKVLDIKKSDSTALVGYVKNKISRDARTFKSKESLVEKLKVEYHYNDADKMKAFKFLEKNIPVGFFSNPDSTDLTQLEGIENLKPIFTFADQKVSVKDFAKFIARFQGMEIKGSIIDFMNERYSYFVQSTILMYENEHLENKYPEFKYLVTEYHEGMILYEINSTEVWNKALQDSVGLAEFYELTKTKYPVDSSNPNTYKPFSEVRAAVITDYQDALDKKWIEILKQKYPVTIDEKIYSTILK